jgi:hypothetical protein
MKRVGGLLLFGQIGYRVTNIDRRDHFPLRAANKTATYRIRHSPFDNRQLLPPVGKQAT